MATKISERQKRVSDNMDVDLNEKELYTIGEVSKICNISKKALRFYDKIGLIAPDKISEDNGYRYYSRETLLFVPVIKYFKQMGFKLDEMKTFLEGNTYFAHEKSFRKKIEELKALEQEIHMSVTSVTDWYDLILEAESVIENNVAEVSVKYMEPLTTCYLEQEFDHRYMESIINIDWTNYLESIGKAITGAVILHFPDCTEKIKGNRTKCQILQKVIGDCGNNPTITIGGSMVASCYHIGSHETIDKTYAKIFEWAEEHGYECTNESVERYVTDYWTIRKSEEFVTEVSVKIARKQVDK